MKGTAFINRCCRKSTQMFEELYLQTQVGGLQALLGSLLESKNLGSNEALSTRPFCVMCKRVRATLAPKVTRRTGSFKRPPQAKAEAAVRA